MVSYLIILTLFQNREQTGSGKPVEKLGDAEKKLIQAKLDAEKKAAEEAAKKK
jgi:hypothetical protein